LAIDISLNAAGALRRVVGRPDDSRAYSGQGRHLRLGSGGGDAGARIYDI